MRDSWIIASQLLEIPPLAPAALGRDDKSDAALGTTELQAAPRHATSMILYRTADGRTRVECRFAEETLWLTQAQMAELFQSSVPNINIHLKAIYADGEVQPDATIKSYLIVQQEGGRTVSRPVLHYALPAILAVGFRVQSPRGTEFRQWATARLSEFLVKGFTLDDETQTFFQVDLRSSTGSGLTSMNGHAPDPSTSLRLCRRSGRDDMV